MRHKLFFTVSILVATPTTSFSQYYHEIFIKSYTSWSLMTSAEKQVYVAGVIDALFTVSDAQFSYQAAIRDGIECFRSRQYSPIDIVTMLDAHYLLLERDKRQPVDELINMIFNQCWNHIESMKEIRKVFKNRNIEK